MELKSPVVQPMRQRKVLTPARCQADFKVQNWRDLYPGLELQVAFWWTERMCVCLGMALLLFASSRIDAPKQFKLELRFPCIKLEGRVE